MFFHVNLKGHVNKKGLNVNKKGLNVNNNGAQVKVK